MWAVKKQLKSYKKSHAVKHQSWQNQGNFLFSMGMGRNCCWEGWSFVLPRVHFKTSFRTLWSKITYYILKKINVIISQLLGKQKLVFFFKKVPPTANSTMCGGRGLPTGGYELSTSDLFQQLLPFEIIFCNILWPKALKDYLFFP